MNSSRQTQAQESVRATDQRHADASVVPMGIDAFFSVMKTLLVDGVDGIADFHVDAPVHKSLTSLHLAALHGRLDVLTLLLANRATVDAVTLDGLTPLHYACSKGHIGAVKKLLDKQADVNTANLDGWTPLHIAAQCGAVDVVTALLASQANVDALTREDRATPLFLAAQHGHDDAVMLLLEHQASVDAATKSGDTPLHIACDKGHLGVVSALLESRANADSPNNAGDTPLYIAAEQAHAAVVSALLTHRTNRASVGGTKALVFAAQQGYADVVSALLEARVDVNSTDERGSTALHMAVHQGHKGVVTQLIANQATVDAANVDGWTPLHSAAENGHLDVVSVLLSNQANVGVTDVHGVTPLHCAAQHGRMDVVSALLAKEADVDQATKSGMTPLFVAAGQGHTNVMSALLTADANADAADVDGWTPLHIAAKNGREGAVSELLASGATVNAEDLNGSTPLHVAASLDRGGVVIALLEKQANVNAAILNGLTPLHFAAQSGYENIVGLLLQHEADVDAVDIFAATPLVYAVGSGHISIVNRLLSGHSGADVEGVNANGWTLLHLAARGGDAAMVTALLANGANANAATMDEIGVTPLHLAVALDDVEVVSVLLAHQARVDAVAEGSATPLHIAAQHGSVGVALVLLANGANVEAVALNGVTPLHAAARGGNLDVLSVLVGKQARVDVTDAEGATPLHYAAKSGHADAIPKLLANGANVAALTGNGATPLHIAAQNGHVEVVEMLLGVLARPSHFPDGERLDATRDPERASELVTSAPTVDTTSISSAHYLQFADLNGNTPMLAAARSGHFDVVEALIEAGASVCDRTEAGETVLISAARCKNLSAVSMLFDLGCLTPKDADGEPQSLLAVTLQTVKAYALQAHEFKAMWLQMVARLLDVYERLKEAGESQREIIYQLTLVVVQVIQLKPACSESSVFARLVASSSIVARFRDLHNELTLMERRASPDSTEPELSKWATQCDGDECALLNAFREKIEDDAFLNSSLLEEEDQVEAASLLQHIVRVHGDKCSPDLLNLLESSLSKVLSVSNVVAPSIPEWFIPPHELGFHVMKDGREVTTAGSSLDLVLSSGKWSSSSSTARQYRTQRETFVDSVETCMPLAHPNVVKVYGALHLSSPPIAVFESVSSTNLREYLSSEEKKSALWQRLYEALLGLKYLLDCGVFIKILRCDHIWVGRDGVAKINAFSGCVASLEDFKLQQTRWLAPEVVSGGVVSMASSIYSFGMCILEAHTGKVPWGSLTEGLLTAEILGGFRPELPDGMTENQRKLLERMWLADPSKRPSISEVVQHLKVFAEEQQCRARGTLGKDEGDEPRGESLWVNFDGFVSPELGWTLTDFLKKLETKCIYCRESKEAVQHIFERLRDVHRLLQMQHRKPRDIALVTFCELLASFDRFLGTAMREKSVLERAKSQKVALQSHEHHKQLDELLELLPSPTVDPIHQWRHLIAVPEEYVVSENSPEVIATTSEEAVQATAVRAVKIVRLETGKLDQRFKEIDVEKIDFAAAAAITENAIAARPKWLILSDELKYNRRERAIGTGAFGEVYRATWRGTPVVVKYMGYEADGDAYRREMFAHELRVWFPLNNPHVIKLFGACLVGKLSFVCEFAGNGTLSEYLKRDVKNTDKSWELMRQVSLGLQYLHELNIVHNDLKCDNVLIGSDGIAKITDFGLSCILHSAEVMVDPRKQGASQWKSPEYIRGDRVTLKSDIYSFGMCILEAMTGEPPWGATAIDAAVRFKVKKGLLPLQPACLSDAQWALIQMMCAAEPSRRVDISFVVDKLFEFAQQEHLASRRSGSAVADRQSAP